MSRIRRYPTNRLVHSSFGFFARRRGGALPGSWFVEAFASLQVEEASVRQTLHRMEKAAEIESTRLGRDKLYRPTSFSWAAIDAGAARLVGPQVLESWDGSWTLVRFQLGASQRIARERLQTILETEGFARLASGLYVHPRDRADRVLTAAASEGHGAALMVFRGPRRGGPTDEQLVADLWRHRELAGDYRRFVRRYEPFTAVGDDVAPRDAFALKLALVLDYLEVAWRDPSLPTEVLPADWPGDRAQELTRSLNDRLLPLATAFGEAVLLDVVRRSSRLSAHFDNYLPSRSARHRECQRRRKDTCTR